jgi:hypothetical protein
MMPTAATWIQSSDSSDVDAFVYVSNRRYAHFAPGTINPDTGTLYVRFKRKMRVYAYYDVTEQEYDDFFSAASKGRYVHDALYSHVAERIT